MDATIGKLTRKGKIHVFHARAMGRTRARCRALGEIINPVGITTDELLQDGMRGFCVGCRIVLKREAQRCPEPTTYPVPIESPAKPSKTLRQRFSVALKKLRGSSRRH